MSAAHYLTLVRHRNSLRLRIRTARLQGDRLEELMLMEELAHEEREERDLKREAE